MNTFLRWAAMMLISAITDYALDKVQVERIKNFIVSQSNEAISNAIKHERAAALIKELAGDLSDVVVDWIVRTVLWVARATGQIEASK
jgi:hypothetical protein